MSPAVIDEMSLNLLMEAMAFRFAYNEQRELTAWRQTRMAAYFSVAPHAGKNKKLRPEDLMKLPGDEQDKGTYSHLSDEERLKLYKDKIARWNATNPDG